MMHNFDPGKMLPAYSLVLPLAMALLSDPDEQTLVIQLYEEHRGLMFKTAVSFFGRNYAEVEDAVSASLERICKYIYKIEPLPCNKRESYLVKIVVNVCKNRLIELNKQNVHQDAYVDQHALEAIPGEDDVYQIAFDNASAEELLNSFDGLSDRDKEIFRKRHIEHLEFCEIAEAFQMTQQAVRTALSRTKKRMAESVTQRKGENP